MRLKEIDTANDAILHLTYEIEDDESIAKINKGICTTLTMNRLFVMGEVTVDTIIRNTFGISISLCSKAYCKLLKFAISKNILELQVDYDDPTGIVSFNLDYGEKFDNLCYESTNCDFPMSIRNLIVACGGIFSPCDIIAMGDGSTITLPVPGSMRKEPNSNEQYMLSLTESGWVICQHDTIIEEGMGKRSTLLEAIMLSNDLMSLECTKHQIRKSMKEYIQDYGLIRSIKL